MCLNISLNDSKILAVQLWSLALILFQINRVNVGISSTSGTKGMLSIVTFQILEQCVLLHLVNLWDRPSHLILSLDILSCFSCSNFYSFFITPYEIW